MSIKLPEMPNDWEYVPVVEWIHQVKTGIKSFEGTKKYYSTGSIGIGNIDFEKLVTFDNKPSRANRIAKEGDVLQARMSNTNKPVLVSKDLEDGIFSTGFIQFRPESDVVSKYLYHFFKSPLFLIQRDYYATGSTQVAINDKNFKNIMIPKPHDIKKLKNLCINLDRSNERILLFENNVKEITHEIRLLKVSTLVSAINGTLDTKIDIDKNDQFIASKGRDFLDSILSSRKEKWLDFNAGKALKKHRLKAIENNESVLDDKNSRLYQELRGKLAKKYKTPKGVQDIETLDLPQGWYIATLDQLLFEIEAGKNFRCIERPPNNDEVGVVKVSAVSWGEFDQYESKTCPSPELIREEFMINSGDFLISRANTIELVGAVVIVSDFDKELMLSDKVLRLYLDERIKWWVLWVLRSPFGREQIEKFSTGNQNSMRNISQENMRKIQIPLPPENICNNICSSLDSIFSGLQKCENLMDENSTLKSEFLDSILVNGIIEG